MSVNRNLEEAHDVWQAWKHLGAKLTAIGSIFFGYIVYSGIIDMQKEIPIYQELGVSLMVFGVLLFIALSGKGGIFSIIKNFLISMAVGILAAMSAFGAMSADTWYAQLGFAVLTLLSGVYMLDRLWATVTGKPAPDEVDLDGKPL